MKRLIVILIFAVVIIFVILVVVYFSFFYQDVYKICEGKQDIEGCKRLVTGCERMSGYEQRICYRSIATGLNDPSICDKTEKC